MEEYLSWQVPDRIFVLLTPFSLYLIDTENETTTFSPLEEEKTTITDFLIDEETTIADFSIDEEITIVNDFSIEENAKTTMTDFMNEEETTNSFEQDQMINCNKIENVSVKNKQYDI